MDREGNVYVADTHNHRVQRFNRSGEFLGMWGSRGTADGQFSAPVGMAVDDEGKVYVVDQWSRRVQVFGQAPTP